MRKKQYLGVLLTVFCSVQLSGIAALPQWEATASNTSDQEALHLLNRLAFGPRPGDVARVKAMGVEAYLNQQLSPQTLAEPSSLTESLNAMPTRRLSQAELFQQYSPIPARLKGGAAPTEEELRAARKKA